MAGNLENYLINYTELARQGKLVDLVGRESELERLLHILLRTNANNPIVIGQPGVGKSALIEGLTAFIASENAPDYLQAKSVVEIDLSLIHI